MLQRKYFYLLSLILVIVFLSACSRKNNNETDNTRTAKTVKAKIIYFSIHG